MATVLVVDDNANNRALLARILQQHDHRVFESANGAEALGLARLRQPDVVITDILMPKVDGFELERALRADEQTAAIPVILHTAAYSEREVTDVVAASSSRVRVLPKPSEVGEVLEVVEAAVAGAPGATMDVGARDRQDHLEALNAKLLQSVRELETAARRRQELLAHVIQVQENERAVIAADIHDDSIQAMTAVAMRLELFGRGLADPDMVERHRKLEESVRLAIGRLRRLLFQLHPPALERDGLVATLEAYMAQTFDAGHHEVIDDLVHEPPAELQILLYRVAQEALTNVRKHADADTVRVTLANEADGIAVTVEDAGRGFDPEVADAYRPGHLGISSMRQRVEVAGGRWRLDSSPGRGTVVQTWVPVAGAAS